MSPRKRTTKAGPTPVEALRHTDRRANIPTNELRGMLADDERTPKAMLYPRDPSLDPQLVWKGKDEQDAADLEVPVVPIYIQEKIQPRVIIENLRDTAAAGEPEPELTLFDDFNGIAFEGLVDFYQHDQNWGNRLILGDSLLVMTSLAEKEGLKGQVQTIYLDPPYGIKFGSNWQVSTRKREVSDGKLTDVTRQPEQIRAFRDTRELGIHSYLTYLRDRLVVARELLNETDSIFAQIGDENVHLVRSLLDEVFGSQNFVSHHLQEDQRLHERLPARHDRLHSLVRQGQTLGEVQASLPRQDCRWSRCWGVPPYRATGRLAATMTPAEREDTAPLPIGARPFRSTI